MHRSIFIVSEGPVSKGGGRGVEIWYANGSRRLMDDHVLDEPQLRDAFINADSLRVALKERGYSVDGAGPSDIGGLCAFLWEIDDLIFVHFSDDDGAWVRANGWRDRVDGTWFIPEQEPAPDVNMPYLFPSPIELPKGALIRLTIDTGDGEKEVLNAKADYVAPILTGFYVRKPADEVDTTE